MGIAGTGLLPLHSCQANHAEEVLRNQALQAFKRFKEVWNFKDFWKRGNIFDVCLNFVQAVRTTWPKHPEVIKMTDDVHAMLAENLIFFRSVKVEKMWVDDFGWWGIMGLNARQFLLEVEDTQLADEYWHLANDLCWEYKKNTAYDYSADALPVPLGCRNGDAAGQNLGVKNTVTNVLLLLLSTRIYRVALEENRPDRDKYLEMIYRQWLWFSHWFTLNEYQYLKPLVNHDGSLVQERPMAEFKGSDYTDKIHPPWHEGWVWTGDQGMLIAALSDIDEIKNELATYVISQDYDANFQADDLEKQALNIIQQIANGVKHALVSEADGIVREAPCIASFGQKHGRDYVAGRGILARYLGHKEVKVKLGVKLDAEIQKTVIAIWESRDSSNNQFTPEFTSFENDKLYVEQFRKLWGMADEVHKWDLSKMREKNKYGVTQAIGLDFMGAAIQSFNK